LGAEVSVALLTTEFEKLGLRVGEKHLLEVLADQNIGGIILNAAGVFDVVKSKNISRQTLLKLNSKDREDADLNAKYQMYTTMIKAVYTTESEGKFKYEMESNKVNFAYVAGLYSTIKDSDVKITDAEIVDFMKKMKKYKSRGVS
jgi:peptidyl-prolyl cis-trans isomerase D